MITTEQVLTRGTTVQFTTAFFDVNGAPVNPAGAFVNISYTASDATLETTNIPMTPPVSGFNWTALWDSRNIPPGKITWSIHSMGPIPVSVEDGQFLLLANSANLLTFS